MAGLKLESFAADLREAGRGERKEDTAKLVAQAYREGHAKGFAQGAEASAQEHAEAQDQLRMQFIEALRDSQLTQSAAQAAVVSSLLETLVALVEGLAPTLAKAELGEILRETLSRALEARPAAKPRLSCAPELVEGLTEAFTLWNGDFELIPDPRLTPLEAKLVWDDGFDHIDLDASLKEIRRTVQGFQASTLETEEVRDVG